MPKYHPGVAACITATGIIVVVVLVLDVVFMRANRKADAGGRWIEGLEGFR
jgi:hypothetical protein